MISDDLSLNICTSEIVRQITVLRRHITNWYNSCCVAPVILPMIAPRWSVAALLMQNLF